MDTSVPAPITRPDPADLAVATRGLVKSYGRHKALVGLDMSVPRGRVYGFLGPNGSGKTTALRLLTGLLRPNAGTISLFGTPYTWRDRRRLFRVGSLIETPAFYPYLSGYENLLVLSASGPPTERSRIGQVLEYVGMGNRARDHVQTYSLGMRQRLGIASALLSDPQLLLLDEPANGLDPAGIVAMRELLRGLAAAGKTVFVSSHLLAEVQVLADIVGIIAAGKLVREGPLRELLAAASTVKVRVRPELLEQAQAVLNQLAPTERLVESDRVEGWLLVHISSDRSEEVNRKLSEAGLYAAGLEAGNDLELLFLELTSHQAAGAEGSIPMRPQA